MIALVMLARMGLDVEFSREPGNNQYRVRAWNNCWRKTITFSAIDEWDLACNIDIALGKLFAHAISASAAGKLDPPPLKMKPGE